MPDLEDRVGAEAIRSEIRIGLPLLRSTCDTVYCLVERALHLMMSTQLTANLTLE